MKQNLNSELLKNLQNACNIMTEGYRMQNGHNRIKFDVLQMLVRKCPKCRC